MLQGNVYPALIAQTRSRREEEVDMIFKFAGNAKKSTVYSKYIFLRNNLRYTPVEVELKGLRNGD